MNWSKNIFTTVSIVFLFLAILEGWPHGFYTILRWVVCGSTVYLAILAYGDKKQFWSLIFGVTALVFNPLIPFRLGRDTWVFIDWIVIILLIVSIFSFKMPAQVRGDKGEQEQL